MVGFIMLADPEGGGGDSSSSDASPKWDHHDPVIFFEDKPEGPNSKKEAKASKGKSKEDRVSTSGTTVAHSGAAASPRPVPDSEWSYGGSTVTKGSEKPFTLGCSVQSMQVYGVKFKMKVDGSEQTGVSVSKFQPGAKTLSRLTETLSKAMPKLGPGVSVDIDNKGKARVNFGYGASAPAIAGADAGFSGYVDPAKSSPIDIGESDAYAKVNLFNLSCEARTRSANWYANALKEYFSDLHNEASRALLPRIP